MVPLHPLSFAASTLVIWLLVSAAVQAEPAKVDTLHAIREAATVDRQTRVELLAPFAEGGVNADLARWHMGQIQSGDSWLPVEEHTELRVQDPQLQEYAARRDAVAKGHQSEFGLAGWCRTQKRYDAERVHLHHVVRSSHESMEDRAKAMQRLGLKVYQGRIRTQQQIKAIQQRLDKERRAEAKWRPVVGRWIEAIEQRQGRKQRYAVSELRKVEDPDAVLTLEKMLSYRSEQFANEFVSIARGILDVRSTESLVRQSVDSPWRSIRDQAVEALKKRPLHDYMPLLLDELNSPVESRFRVGIDADGMVRRSHQFYREDRDAMHLTSITNARGPEPINRTVAIVHPRRGVSLAPADQAQETGALLSPRTMRQMLPIRRRASEYNEQDLEEWAARRERQLRLAFARQVIAQQEAVQALQVQAQLSARNQQVNARNKRVFAALRNTAGEDQVPTTAVAWWDWWNDYNDHYVEEKPTYTHVAGRSDPMQVTYIPIDCFPAGTLVHTEVGPKPIEDVRAGDRVLSQNVDTGELAYKIIVRRTVRPPSEVLNLTLSDGEMIRTTKGHPFWVNHVGWRMAKQLNPEQHIHSVFGDGRVTQVEKHSENVPAINLVVDDFGTFFIGEQGLLVHGTPHRKPTTAIVPGVLAEQLNSEL